MAFKFIFVFSRLLRSESWPIPSRMSTFYAGQLEDALAHFETAKHGNA